MYNANSTCFNRTVPHDESTELIFTGMNAIIAIFGLLSNSFACIGIWLVYKKTLKRTPKLLLSLFVTNIIAVLAITSLSIYKFFKEIREFLLISAHVSLAVFLVLLSSTTLCLVTVDRYLIVRHGIRYRLWKKHFRNLATVTVITVAAFSSCLFFSLISKKCSLISMMIASIAVAIFFNLAISIAANILLFNFILSNITVIGRSNTKEITVAKTIKKMATFDVSCQTLVILAVSLYVGSIIAWTEIRKYEHVILLFIGTISLLKCGTVPLGYIFSNRRMIHQLF